MNNKYKFNFIIEEGYITKVIMLENKDQDIEEKVNTEDTEDKKNNHRNVNLNNVINSLINGVSYKGILKYKAKGTDFQEKVWREIEKIPYGETRTYKDIAVAIGNSKASRAVGSACNKNPLPIVIPCHRVISSNGSLNGYVYGSELKAHILTMEGENKMK